MADTRYREWLKSHRPDGRPSQEAIAARCVHVRGLKQSHISLIERGEFIPDGEQHDAIAAALDLSEEQSAEGAALLRLDHLDRLQLAEADDPDPADLPPEKSADTERAA